MKAAVLALIAAYIMPSYGVLKRFSNERDGLTVVNLTAEGVAAVSPVLAKDVSALMGITWNSGELMLNASLAVRFPGRCRLELSSPESTKVLAAASTSGKSRTEGGDVQALLVGLEQACALLSLKSMQTMRGVASLGVRPTVLENGKPVLEVYLFDFDQEIYGQHLRVHFLRKLRDEEKFSDLETLTRQIARDVEQAKNYFTTSPSTFSADIEESLPNRLN